MKLRALQKHLLLDLISLPAIDETLKRFRNFKLDDRISIEDTISALVPLFEDIHVHYPNLVRNVPMAVDLALNLVLNIYDPCRDGRMRILSFAVTLVVLCNSTLESKYKYLFSLISDDEGVTHKKLGLLFYDLIHASFKLYHLNTVFIACRSPNSWESLPFSEGAMLSPPSDLVSNTTSIRAHCLLTVIWIGYERNPKI